MIVPNEAAFNQRGVLESFSLGRLPIQATDGNSVLHPDAAQMEGILLYLPNPKIARKAILDACLEARNPSDHSTSRKTAFVSKEPYCLFFAQAIVPSRTPTINPFRQPQRPGILQQSEASNFCPSRRLVAHPCHASCSPCGG